MAAPSLNPVEPSKRIVWLSKALKAYLALTKPRIVLLMILTTLCSAIVAAGKFPDWETIAVVTVGLALSAGGASAFNMWYDRDIDQMMKRTMKRPLPTGQLSDQSALTFGLSLGLLSMVWFGVFGNLLTFSLSLAGFVYYTVIYTMWLKRKTPHNIVIGSGAGAIPPMIGWAAVTGEIGWPAVMMFIIIFLWTPPHFWPLAIVRNDEYKQAGIPMMPAVRGFRYTKKQCLLYTIILLFTTTSLYFTGIFGGLYLIVAILSGLIFLYFQIRMYYEQNNQTVWAQRAFIASRGYLAILFVFMAIDTLLARGVML